MSGLSTFERAQMGQLRVAFNFQVNADNHLIHAGAHER